MPPRGSTCSLGCRTDKLGARRPSLLRLPEALAAAQGAQQLPIPAEIFALPSSFVCLQNLPYLVFRSDRPSKESGGIPGVTRDSWPECVVYWSIQTSVRSWPMKWLGVMLQPLSFDE